MLDGSALPKTHSQPSRPTLAGRLVLTPQTWQAVLIVLGIAVVTFVLYLYVLPNSQIDAARVRIADLQAQKAMLERENAALMQEIARASNLKTLEVRARALGMGPATSAIYLRLPGQGPTPAVQPTTDQADPATENTLATVTQWLQREHLQERLRDLRWQVSQAVEGIIQAFQSN
jgi:hypothetical protein